MKECPHEPLFRVLGDVSMASSSRVVLPRSRRLRCVLGVLLVELGRPVSVERLIRLLWDHAPPATADNMVHNIVCQLRGVLSAEPEAVAIRTVGPEYQLLADPNQVDLHLFRSVVEEARDIDDPTQKILTLFAALALWDGPVLGDAATESTRYLVCAPLERERLEAELAYQAALDSSGVPAGVVNG